MSDFSDIEPDDDGWRRLSYTTRCGWVDWGHASPGGASRLKAQLDNQKSASGELARLSLTLSGKPAFAISYGLEMRLGIGPSNYYIIRRDLGSSARERVALGIYLAASNQMESYQGKGSLVSLLPKSRASSYSVEDLVSNIIGFYRAYRGYDGPQSRAYCGELSVEESRRVWEDNLPKGLGVVKNTTTSPKLYDTSKLLLACVDTSFPAEFSTITPAISGIDWVIVRASLIRKHLADPSRQLAVDSAGLITVK